MDEDRIFAEHRPPHPARDTLERAPRTEGAVTGAVSERDATGPRYGGTPLRPRALLDTGKPPMNGRFLSCKTLIETIS
jgi:hypothetical protein